MINFLSKKRTFFTALNVPVRTSLGGLIILLLVMFLLIIPLKAPIFLYPVYILGILGILIVHEYGHALAAWHQKMRVIEIRLEWWGGVCEVKRDSYTSRKSLFVLYSGGLALQALLCVLFAPLCFVTPPLVSQVIFDLFVLINVSIAAANLLPIPRTDGHFIWRYLLNKKF